MKQTKQKSSSEHAEMDQTVLNVVVSFQIRQLIPLRIFGTHSCGPQLFQLDDKQFSLSALKHIRILLNKKMKQSDSVAEETMDQQPTTE